MLLAQPQPTMSSELRPSTGSTTQERSYQGQGLCRAQQRTASTTLDPGPILSRRPSGLGSEQGHHRNRELGRCRGRGQRKEEKGWCGEHRGRHTYPYVRLSNRPVPPATSSPPFLSDSVCDYSHFASNTNTRGANLQEEGSGLDHVETPPFVMPDRRGTGHSAVPERAP